MPPSLRVIGLIGLIGVSTLLTGCATVMASRQPSAKNLDVLQPGTPRETVIAEFGWPEHSTQLDGKRLDQFSIVQGYSKGAKIGRTVFHGLADALTLGAWEVIGTPTEMIFNGQKLMIQVYYDPADKVDHSEVIQKK